MAWARSTAPAVSGQSIPRAGNAAFAIGCVNAPRSAAGVAILTFDGLATPLPVLGIDLWVNPTTILATTVVVSNAEGRGTLALQIPSDVLPGTQIFDQFIWIGPNAPPPCPPTGVSASNAVRITVQS